MFSPVRMSPMNKSKRNQRYEKPYSREVQGTPGGFWFSEQSAIFFHFFLFFCCFSTFCLELPGVPWTYFLGEYPSQISDFPTPQVDCVSTIVSEKCRIY